MSLSEEQKLNTHCVVCGTKFPENEIRKGKLYCSDTCNKRAYRDRINKKELEEHEEKEKLKKKIEQENRFKFFFSRFEIERQWLGFVGDISFAMYCYFRYNIEDNLPEDKIQEVFLTYNIEDIKEGGKLYDSFIKFCDRFFHTENCVSDSPDIM